MYVSYLFIYISALSNSAFNLSPVWNDWYKRTQSEQNTLGYVSLLRSNRSGAVRVYRQDSLSSFCLWLNLSRPPYHRLYWCLGRRFVQGMSEICKRVLQGARTCQRKKKSGLSVWVFCLYVWVFCLYTPDISDLYKRACPTTIQLTDSQWSCLCCGLTLSPAGSCCWPRCCDCDL